MAGALGNGQLSGAGRLDVAGVVTVADLARLLRGLRRRQARRAGETPLTVRELAARTGWSRGIIGEYLAGRVLAPTDRFDELVRLLGASPAEQGALATARDGVEEHRRALSSTAGRARSAAAGTGPLGCGGEVPAQLPAPVAAFTGRQGELAHLDGLLSPVGQDTRPAAVVISAVSGTAGVGKTALALHWAHQNTERFPDGQLYINLRGFGPTGTVTDPGEALRGFLGAFGVLAQRIPAGLAAQSGLYRSVLAGKRVLVVLDNARDVEQVRPLLPATDGCLAVVTSRHQLTGLAATEGAHLLTLDLLSPAEARELLTARVGSDRVTAEPQAVDDIINHCARLPLALAIIAARAAVHPGFSLQVLAKELTDAHTRLAALDTGEAPTSIRSVFSWSYHQLSPPAARMFRLVGLHPGPDLALPAAAQLADLPTGQAREALSELTRAHLLTQHTPGRYSCHDLLRAYATDLVTRHDSADDQRAAHTRLFDHYLHTATAAMHTLHPTPEPHRPDVPAPAPPAPATPAATDPVTARNWLDAERANLITLIGYTAAHGWFTHTTRLANTILFRFETGGPYCGEVHRDALTLYTHVRNAAHHSGDRATEALALTSLGIVHEQRSQCRQALDDYQQALLICRDLGFPVGEAFTLTGLGNVCWQLGRFPQATDHLQRVLVICRDLGLRAVEARALTILGLVCCQQGRFPQATDHYQQALAICRDLDLRPVEALALTGFGVVHRRQGRYQQATDYSRQALVICRDINLPITEAYALTHLGAVDCRQGRYQQAAAHHQHALTLCHDSGSRIVEILTLTNLGLVYTRQGRHQQAIEHHQRALTLSRKLGDRTSEALILNGLGEAHHAAGQPNQAHTQHTAALTVATEVGDHHEQTRARHGLARTHPTTGELTLAHHHYQQALALFTDLGVPDAEVGE